MIEQKHKEPTIVYTKWGYANYYPQENLIEINEGLQENPYLLNFVLKHELGHTYKFDLLHEANINVNVMPKLILFMITHPRTWVDISPIQLKRGNIVFDWNLILLDCLLFGLGYGAFALFKYIF